MFVVTAKQNGDLTGISERERELSPGKSSAANASAQQYWMEEVLEQQLAEQSVESTQDDTAATADQKAEEKADSNAS